MNDLVLTHPEPKPEDQMLSFIERAAHDPSFDVQKFKELLAMRDKEMARNAEQQFNDAMNAAQSEMGRIAPDKVNGGAGNAKYASYARLDSVLRPIYIRHGFSLSFDSGPAPSADMVVAFCYVSHRAGHTRKYQSPPIPAGGKGAKGNDVMTPTHATGSAMSYGMRYLLKFIFNVAIGEDDDDGNLGGDLKERIEFLQNASTVAEATHMFKLYYPEFKTKAGKVALIDAYEATKKRLKELE